MGIVPVTAAQGYPCPSPDARCAHPAVAPSPPSQRRLRLTVAGQSPAPSMRRFARSMLTSLRHPWLRLSATPAHGHGQPLADPRFRQADGPTGCWPPVMRCLRLSPSDATSAHRRSSRSEARAEAG